MTIMEEYLSDLSIIKNRSNSTVENYKFDLTVFFRYINAVKNGLDLTGEEFDSYNANEADLDFLRQITRDDIYSFLKYTKDQRGNNVKARARKLAALRSFYKYLTVNKNYLEINPTKDIDTPPVKSKTLPKYLTIEESIHLLEAVQGDTESKTTARDFAIITLFLNCGMRLSELVGISLDDIDTQLRSVRILGKGSKERIIYLNDACRSALFEYLKVRKSLPHIKDKNALFLSSRYIRISNKTIQWMVYKYLCAAGLENKKFSTHKLRHTAATLMYQTGEVDVLMLKEILGHEQLNTTQIYTHVSDEGLEKAMTKNPLSNIKMKKRTPKIPESGNTDKTDEENNQ